MKAIHLRFRDTLHFFQQTGWKLNVKLHITVLDLKETCGQERSKKPSLQGSIFLLDSQLQTPLLFVNVNSSK